MEDIKNKLKSIIEQAESDKPACKYCTSYKNGGCSYGCLNEKVKLTTPNYSCDNFKSNYGFNENTVETLKDLLKDAERVAESIKNLELLLNGKISEKDFVELVD